MMISEIWSQLHMTIAQCMYKQMCVEIFAQHPFRSQCLTHAGHFFLSKEFVHGAPFCAYLAFAQRCYSSVLLPHRKTPTHALPQAVGIYRMSHDNRTQFLDESVSQKAAGLRDASLKIQLLVNASIFFSVIPQKRYLNGTKRNYLN